MWLISGVGLGLTGLILIGVSGNEHPGRRRRRTRPWLAWLGVLMIFGGLSLAVVEPILMPAV